MTDRWRVVLTKRGMPRLSDLLPDVAERGGPADDLLSEIEAYQKAVDLMSHPQQRPDAIMAATDRQATGVLRAAHELGLRIPADIGVAGQGDTVIARNSRPALTSIRLGGPAVLGGQTVIA